MANNNNRKRKTSPVQLEIMITFMEKHLDFARGALKRNESDRLWNQLQTKLNAVPDGPVKTVKQWKMTWYYRKRCVKKDVKALCAQQKMDPDEVLQVHGLRDTDYRILKIMGNIEILKEDDESVSVSEESEPEDVPQPPTTRSVSRASQNSTRTNNSETSVKRADHFASYITERINDIKNEKKRQNLEDEIIDLIRKCTLEDK